MIEGTEFNILFLLFFRHLSLFLYSIGGRNLKRISGILEFCGANVEPRFKNEPKPMKATYKISLRKRKSDKNGEHYLYMIYTFRRQKTFISLNICLKSSQWNDSARTVRPSHPKAFIYNKFLKDIEGKADDLIINNYHEPLVGKEFRNRLFTKVIPGSIPVSDTMIHPMPTVHSNDMSNCHKESFYEFIMPEIELEKPLKEEGTISNYYKLLNKMKSWGKIRFKKSP